MSDKPISFKIKFQNISRKPRATRIFLEKERLYDENIQLKQLSNSLVDENQKLKTKLLQREHDFKKPFEKEYKSNNLTSSLKFQIKELKDKIEKIQSEYSELKISVRATRVAELEEEAKQYFNECWRLKKLIEDGVTTQSRDNPNSNNPDLPEKKSKPKSSELEVLQSEITLLKSQNEKALKDMKIYKLQAEECKKQLDQSQLELSEAKSELLALSQSKKSERALLENLEKSLGPEETKESLLPPSFSQFKRASTKSSDKSSKDLERELVSNPELILDRFFKSLNEQINRKNITTAEFISGLNPDDSGKLDLQKFPNLLKEIGFKFTNNELKSVYSILSANGQQVSVKVLENYLDLLHQESDKSYDISSEFSYSNKFVSNELALAKISNVNEEELEGIFEFLLVLLKHQGLNRGKFRSFMESKLPESVNLADLAKLFLEKTCRIEEGVERNKFCSFVLENKEFDDRETVIAKVLLLVFKEFGEEGNAEKVKQVLEDLKGMKVLLMGRFVEMDKREKGWLCWKDIEVVLKDCLKVWDDEAVLGLKVKTYGIEGSLNIIPYESIFDLS